MRANMSQQSMSRVHLPFAKVDNSTTHHKIANCPPPSNGNGASNLLISLPGRCKILRLCRGNLVTISKRLAFSTFRGHRGHRKISPIALF
jgi:hypothetical protein